MAEASSIPDSAGTKKRKNKIFAITCSLLASMTAIVLGYDIGVMSGALLFIRQDLKITETQMEILAGILNIYSLIGAGLAGRTADWIGRRYTIVLAASIFFAGALLMGFATSYAFLMLGRFVAGVAVGYAMMIAPLYTAEIAPASSRGLLTSFTEVFVNVGILLGYISNFAFSKLPVHLGWRFMLGAGAVPSVFLGLFVLFMMPESPRWLVMKGRLGDAKRVLEKTSETPEEVQLRLSEIKETIGIPDDAQGETCPVPQKASESTVWKELLLKPTPAVRHILIVAIGCHFFQQASGIDALVLFSPRVFEKAGVKTTHDQLLATVAMGLVKTSFIMVATFFLDRAGRRPLVLSSIGSMAVLLAALGVGLTVIDHNDHTVKWAVVLSVFCVLAFVAVFSIGMGPIIYVYCSEVYPLRLRALGCGIGIAVNRVISGIISMTFLSLARAITTGGAFFMFAAIAAIGFFFFYVLLPETKQIDLEDIDKLFGTYYKWKTTLKELKEMKAAEAVENGKGQIQML